jgi:hypothetical protein
LGQNNFINVKKLQLCACLITESCSDRSLDSNIYLYVTLEKKNTNLY